MAKINERRAARGAPPIQHAREERAKTHALVSLVERNGWDDFGFMLFRMDYSDDAKWNRFIEAAFQIFKEEGEVEPGLDTKMCLMVDAECIASVLGARSEEDKTKNPPFVKAVDVNLASETNLSPGFEGHFKVAISALAMEFYLALALFGYPYELAPFADPVWQDALGSPD
ncbi:MAG: hypothetical protein M1820_008272 [Bogoriella megaspora]|nr:MAG: hypothetical protein M1820_008272 [Bogoriella megaspora]